jgi:N-acetylglutamate synthase-like GNAT family acetyltransferase
MKVHENFEEHLPEFIKLNEDWISEYFEIEDVDVALAKNPKKIIEDGGFVFSLVDDGVVVGVCSLFNEGNGIFELARMAVTKQLHSRGYGSLLITVCLTKLSDIGASKVHLVSNTKLEPAINLYKKHGFETVSLEQHPVYSRANISMVLNIS